MVCFWCTNWYANMKVVTPIDTTPSLFISWFALHNTPRYMAVWYYDETSPMQITFARILIGLENPKSSPSISFEADKFILFTMWPMFSFPTITLSLEDMIVGPSRKRTATAMYAQAKLRVPLPLLKGYFEPFLLDRSPTLSWGQVPCIRLLVFPTKIAGWWVLQVFHGIHFPNNGPNKRCAQCSKWIILCLVLISVIWLFRTFVSPVRVSKYACTKIVYKKMIHIPIHTKKYLNMYQK